MQTWSRGSAFFQTKCQNGEEMDCGMEQKTHFTSLVDRLQQQKNKV